MKPAQLKLFLALADLAIPLLGYFFWNWNFYFILLFFVLDFIVSSVFSFVKVKKINAYRGIDASFPFAKLIYSILLIAAGFALLVLALQQTVPGFDLAKETWAFLSYKDMGIAQGIVLLPLLIYGGYTQYKMQFLMNGKFAVATVDETWKMHFTTIFVVLAASGIFLGLSFFVVFPQVAYIIALTFGVVAYRFFYSR